MSAPWNVLRDKLVANGSLTARGSARGAKPRICERCNAPVLIGLDDDIAALDVTADPTPLDALGEILAVAQGRRTYTLAVTGGRHELNYRDEYRIRGRAPGAGHYDVVPEHRCGIAPLPTVAAVTVPAPAAISQECPF